MAASTWWPTPVSPQKLFKPEDLDAARAYNRPLDQAKQLAGFSVVAIMVGLAIATRGADAVGTVQWVVMIAIPLVVFGAASAYALWSGAWHAPAFAMARPPTSQAFGWAFVVAIRAVIPVLALWVALRISDSPVVVLLGGAAVFFAFSRIPSGENHLELSPERLAPLNSVAEWAKFKCHFVQHHNPGVGATANAKMLNGKPTVVVGPHLFDESAELQSLVIAHEVSHLKRSHPARAKALAVGQLALWLTVMVGAFYLITGFSQVWTVPLWCVLGWGVWAALAPIVAFFMRHFERVADADSYELLGTVPTALARQMHARTYADLDPPLLKRLYAHHPPPAERIEIVSRRIKTL